jgi:SAM-dependent methyltransferase
MQGAPDPFLVEAYAEFIAPLFARGGTALDVAGGAGRHAIWLAERRWAVTLLDISEVGIAKARREAGRRRVPLDFIAADAAEWNFGRARYDLILVFYYLERALFPRLTRALRPGGLLVYKTYTAEQPKFGRGPTHPMHFLASGELLRVFRRLQVLQYRETIRERAVAELVGRKL